MIIGVLALQGDTREHLHALAELDVIARPVRRPDELDSVDALVIPGGESTAMSKLAIEFGMTEPLRKRLAGGMPAYGSCAGMIMLAGTILDGRPDQVPFGGIDMTVRRNAFGRQVDSFEGTVDISDIEGGPFSAVFIRAPWVEEVGPGVRVLGRVNGRSGPSGEAARPGLPARSAAGRIVAVRQQHLLATAFHPELTGDLRVHRYFVEMAREAGQTTEG
ncbi:pyridoxal 5'-phosphate synthase glutaminase subunit PdxT [Dactylosporangium sp. NPDC006015]|uniref:pyridoxal 5'-phosphate synthase glutaminase subunit PdxT n=1 Tax=Dactylosporangium sp. NPDC006015 TaxID=3154576 RepID=UPI0033A5F7E4